MEAGIVRGGARYLVGVSLVPGLEPVFLLVLWPEDALDEPLLPPIPLDATVGEPQARARGLVVQPLCCDRSDIDGLAEDGDGARGAGDALDRRPEELRGEGRGLEERGNVCARPEWAGSCRLPIDDACLETRGQKAV